jgi:LysR family glycine cleavage system transcriptional activator
VADEPLVLSIGGFMARRWLPPRLPRLMADPAGAGLQLQVVDRHVDFFREQVDAAIRYGTGQWPGLEGRRLYSEDMYPVCTPQFAQARGIRRVEDIVGAPLLHLRSRPWSIWLEKFGVEGSPASEIWFDDSLLLMEAAAQGLGMALVVEGMVHEELQAGRLVRPLGETHAAGVDVYMVWRPDSPKLARIHALRDWLTDEIEGRHGPAGGQAA